MTYKQDAINIDPFQYGSIDLLANGSIIEIHHPTCAEP